MNEFSISEDVTNALGIIKTLEWNEMIEVEEREKNDWHSINQMRIEKEM